MMLLPSPQLLSLPLEDLISALFLKAVAQLRKLSIVPQARPLGPLLIQALNMLRLILLAHLIF